MIDTLLRFRGKAVALTAVLDESPHGYGLATIHRPSNVDNDLALERIVALLEEAARRMPMVFPVHPRTKARLDDSGLGGRLRGAGVQLIPPQSYLRFLNLMLGASLVLTDSGGIQEETTVLGIPCITLRENTERPITVTVGTNVLVGADRRKAIESIGQVVAGSWKRGAIPEGWDGNAAERIAAHLAATLDRAGRGGATPPVSVATPA